MTVREDAQYIIKRVLDDARPNAATARVLRDINFTGKIYLVAVGKAAWEMAKEACGILGDRITAGAVVTKYGHSGGSLGGLEIFEAGHPLPDENSCAAAEKILSMVGKLNKDDTVLFLLSGGGSALFELPLIDIGELSGINRELISCGADIVEINTVRKRLSAVKGGRFALACAPARVCSIILSDIIGDPVDMIASGPTAPDTSTCSQALEIVKKYGLTLSEKALALLGTETPKELENTENHIIGGVRLLCASAAKAAKELGYNTSILTTSLCCHAREAGSFLASAAACAQTLKHSAAFILGGETVVNVTGSGLGGRNQELALAAGLGISGLRDTAVFSVGSDGTDGPTDAAGGFVDGETVSALNAAGVDGAAMLDNNDAYHALDACGGLIKTGPTGTNMNDFTVLLIKRQPPDTAQL